MSNPGVVILANTNTSLGSFRVEDNIGESIHLHLGEFRYDLSIKELCALSNDIEIAVQEYMSSIPGFNINEISKEFFLQKVHCWTDLVEVKKEKVYLNDLLVDTFDEKGKPVFLPLENSRVIKALNNNSTENDTRYQRNYFGQTNQERVDKMLEMIREKGYPLNNQYIVVFNDQNIIADGQHRAACMFYLYGNIEVEILRMIFKNNKHRSYQPKKLYQKLFVWNKKRIREYIVYAYSVYKKIKIKCNRRLLNRKVQKDRREYRKRKNNNGSTV